MQQNSIKSNKSIGTVFGMILIIISAAFLALSLLSTDTNTNSISDTTNLEPKDHTTIVTDDKFNF